MLYSRDLLILNLDQETGNSTCASWLAYAPEDNGVTVQDAKRSEGFEHKKRDPAAIKQLFALTGRAALVSGAAQGMGRAIALALADAGADLSIADIDTSGLDATAILIRETG